MSTERAADPWGSPSRAALGTDPAQMGLPAGPIASYTYAGDGLRRTKLTADGTTTTYTWDRSRALPVLLAETIDPLGTGNTKTIRYVYDPTGHVLADITTPPTGSETIRWYHHDQLGSTVALTNSSGAITSTYRFTPLGELEDSTGASTNIGWAGEYKDTETGYVYLRARYYDPATGQFLTRDPLVAHTRAAFGYANGNPIRWTDPTGLDPCGDGYFDADPGKRVNCQMTGSTTPMVLNGPGYGADEETLEEACDPADYSNMMRPLDPSDPETYSPRELNRIDPYGPFVSLHQVLEGLWNAVQAVANCLETGSVWGAEGAAGGAYAGLFVGHPEGGAIIGGVGGGLAGCAVGIADPNPPGSGMMGP